MKVREKEINDFLKSRRGLTYLRMKYPKLSLEDAIKEFKNAYTFEKHRSNLQID